VTDVVRLAEESSLSTDKLAIYVRASSEALHSSMPIFHLFRKIFLNPFFALKKKFSNSIILDEKQDHFL